ncbi:hypothetical protein OG596_33495 [Streptomyces sp. NBC_01102]|uniref:hypothetical protein n=1 Tax=Streptomyces sp. NBC_01102 TaxID=2903749 RepID=UPI00386324CC|nr:hypothetical protein OG596_33495 [Streptomyces sp. NBC_01102]
MRTQLPVSEPLAGGYHFYAFPLAIMGTDERAKDWILSNYIHLAHDPDPETSVPFCFYLYDYAISPWLDVVRNTRDWLRAMGTDPVEFCRAAVHAGYYVYLNLDDYFIPSRPGHQVRHGSHDLLICGADDERSVFTSFGYTKNDVMRRAELTFDELRQGYLSLDTVPNDCPQVYLYRPDKDADYTFNFSLVRRSFEDYLDAANVSEQFDMFRVPWERSYGIACYPPLQRYLTDYTEGNTEGDIRYLHILWEHKRLMTLRTERMAELLGGDFAVLADEARGLEKQAFRLRNKMFFREAAGRASEFGGAEIEQLDHMRSTEQRLLEQAVARLRAAVR